MSLSQLLAKQDAAKAANKVAAVTAFHQYPGNDVLSDVATAVGLPGQNASVGGLRCDGSLIRGIPDGDAAEKLIEDVLANPVCIHITLSNGEGLKMCHLYSKGRMKYITKENGMIMIIWGPVTFDVYYCAVTNADLVSMLQTTQTLIAERVVERKLSQYDGSVAVAKISDALASLTAELA